MDLYVGNLASDTTGEELRKTFQAHGVVTSVSLLTTQMSGGRRTGPSRGMGFVIMPNPDQARAAVAGLNLHELRGRAMTIQLARPVALRRHRR
jgi:cold-inducible RNA-binding protein